MYKLSCIFLYMNTVNSYFSAVAEFYIAVFAQRHIILRYLISLWQVGIAVVLSVHFGYLRYLAVGGKSRSYGIFHYPFVESRQSSGQSYAYGTAVGIRLAAEFCGAGAEYLSVGGKLNVGLKARYKFIFHKRSFLSRTQSFTPRSAAL